MVVYREFGKSSFKSSKKLSPEQQADIFVQTRWYIEALRERKRARKATRVAARAAQRALWRSR